jgi:hypothetical protein
MAALSSDEELVDELEGDLLRAGGRLRTLQGTAVCQFLAQPDLPAPSFVSLDWDKRT